MRTSKALLSVITLLTTLSSFNTEKKISLELNLEQGGLYQFHSDNRQQVSTQVGEKAMQNKTHFIGDMDWRVRNKYGKDSTLIDAAYTHMMMDMGAASHQTHIDSKESNTGAGEYFNQLIALMRNHPVTLKTNAHGDILALRGITDLRRAVNDSIQNMPAGVKTMLDKLLSEDVLKTAFSIISVYPAEPVAIGDSWENEVLTDNIATLNIHQTFTLKRFTPTTALIAVSARIESTKDTLSINGMALPAHITGTKSGLYHMDRATGLVSDGDLSQDMVVKMTVMGQSFVVNTTGTSRLTETQKQE